MTAKTSLEIVICVIEKIPYKFYVRGIEFSATSSDLTLAIPYAYKFEDVSGHHKKASLKFFVRVHDTLKSRIQREEDLHNEAIAFGLISKARYPKTEEFSFTTGEWESMKNSSRLSGQNLRIAILRFFYYVNLQWPDQGISVFDLLDNFNNTKEEISDWLRTLSEEDLLIVRGEFTSFRVNRGHTKLQPYKLNPKKIKEIENIVAPDTERKKDQHIIKVFLSYSTKNKKTASDLKDHLEEYGLDVFLAHQTIKVSQQWEDKIRQELHDCQVFIALITKDFIESKWTDQEAGFAMAYDKKIIPVITAKREPHGFLKRYQGEPLKSNKAITTKKIILSIVEDDKLNQSFRNGLIRKLGSSQDFDETHETINKLIEIPGYSSEQLDQMETFIETKRQVRGAFRTESVLEPFIENERK